MAKKFKYKLQKGSKHIRCPKCGKRTFKPYVDAITKKIVDKKKFGRCERINSCQYHEYPKDIKSEEWQDMIFYEPPKPEIIQPDFVPVEIVEKTFNNFKSNVFFIWLVRMFGQDTAFLLQEKYNIGTAKGGGTIFWQQDREGRFRTGKVMYYGIDGKRLKDRPNWFVHFEVKKDFNLMQVFFGEHLMKSDIPVALCESEKTAILMSVFEPDYIWLSAGGANMLNLYRLNRLFRLDYVCPDNGQFQKWQKQTAIFGGRKMDVSVDKAVQNGELKQGDDILDLYLLYEKELSKVS